jgi:hypothetical protein
VALSLAGEEEAAVHPDQNEGGDTLSHLRTSRKAERKAAAGMEFQPEIPCLGSLSDSLHCPRLQTVRHLFCGLPEDTDPHL